ncbi:peptidoglycan DD-metalloendopeptidase family protein [Paenibacillus sp. GCM10027629]|uniref:peptidoglycan DD-metalloendopeptidase family protein n=1 Tax=Paenibacillus sp. GCM10027629 TaxID=3273414 RepID=UPI003635A4B3
MNNEQNKNKAGHEESPKNSLGVTGAKPSSWKRAMSKKWVFPAVYMAAIAILLTVLVVYQGARSKTSPDLSTSTITENVDGTTTTDATTDGKTPDATEVAANSEPIAWPVENEKDVKVVMPFYDTNDSSEVHKDAMVEYNDTFIPNVGIDLARKDDKPFEVLAALSGKVTRADKNPVAGQVVEIQSADGTKTIYQSLTDLKVKKDMEIKQGDVIGTASRNELEKDLGVHVHFEVHKDNKPVNPQTLLGKQ